MPGSGHVRFGRWPGETGCPKGRHRAPSRPRRGAAGTDLPKLLDAATSNDIGTENPFR